MKQKTGLENKDSEPSSMKREWGAAQASISLCMISASPPNTDTPISLAGIFQGKAQSYGGPGHFLSSEKPERVVSLCSSHGLSMGGQGQELRVGAPLTREQNPFSAPEKIGWRHQLSFACLTGSCPVNSTVTISLQRRSAD